MKTEEWTWNSTDRLAMHATGWTPDGAPTALIVFVHGHGDHAGTHGQIAEAFCKRGYEVLGFDLRGHGRSGGRRGHTPSYEALMDDIESFLSQARKRRPGLPTFLYGHSMGGNLVLNFALRRKPDLAGVLATAPWLKLAFQPPAVKVALARVANAVFPAFTQDAGLDLGGLTHDPAINKAHVDDPFGHTLISARLFLTVYEAGLWALDNAGGFGLPLLLLHGTTDPITSFDASSEFAARAGSAARFVPCEGLYHNIHEEPDNAQAMAAIVGWIEERRSATARR